MIQLLLVMECAESMVPVGSVLSNTATLLYKQEAGVASMAVAARKCARWKAAVVLHKHVVSVLSMVLMESACLVGALPTHDLDLNIAVNTAVERRTSRALWRAAPPPLIVRVSVASTAVVKLNAGLQNARLNQSASSTSARSMVGLASAHIHQDAARLHSSLVGTVTGTPESKKTC